MFYRVHLTLVLLWTGLRRGSIGGHHLYLAVEGTPGNLQLTDLQWLPLLLPAG